ncbi:MAG: hypothetical protein WAR22_03980 [Desulfomonilia bacterium]|jgi:hypothetical protein
MKQKQIIPTSDDLFRAEKQVFAGIFGRLYAKYVRSDDQEYAAFLALAIARILLCMPVGDGRAAAFVKQNYERIKLEILELKHETEIRRMVTDTMVMKVVAIHKTRGCGKDDDADPLERIRAMGIYLEGTHPPTPGSFVRSASRFLSSSPISPAIPRWKD